MKILGIDPGFGRTGWGVIEKIGGDFRHVAHGCIETDPDDPFADRLRALRDALKKIIAEYAPARAAVEELFFYKNVTTAIGVAHARGVILLSLADAGIPADECTPLEVKQALTGNGRAEKRQVQAMVPIVLGMKKMAIQDDAADALAVAVAVGSALPFKERTARARY